MLGLPGTEQSINSISNNNYLKKNVIDFAKYRRASFISAVFKTPYPKIQSSGEFFLHKFYGFELLTI